MRSALTSSMVSAESVGNCSTTPRAASTHTYVTVRPFDIGLSWTTIPSVMAADLSRRCMVNRAGSTVLLPMVAWNRTAGASNAPSQH